MTNRLAGKRFGRLTVVKDSGERSKSKAIVWLCRCECGAEAYVIGSNLLKGRTRSCGCYRQEVLEARAKGRKKVE